MRWLTCLRANNLLAIAALMLLAQGEFSPRCSISPQISACTLDQCLIIVSAVTVQTPKM